MNSAEPTSQIPAERWETEITPHRGIFSVPIREMIHYRDLLFLFVRRDFIATYKQTILGPVWFLVQPILTTIMMTFVFGRLAGLSTDGLPKVLFYLAGVTLWGYFAANLNKTASSFTSNAGLFGKVYFPRLLTPMSVVLSNLISFAIQFGMFLAFWSYYCLDGLIQPNWTAFLLPVLIFILGMTGLGFGLIISALTTKYRDLINLLGFGTQLFMYATPIIYPQSIAEGKKYAVFLQANPVTPIIETFRHGFLGVGHFSWLALGYSFLVGLILLLCGMVIFNKVEANFMDTV